MGALAALEAAVGYRAQRAWPGAWHAVAGEHAAGWVGDGQGAVSGLPEARPLSCDRAPPDAVSKLRLGVLNPPGVQLLPSAAPASCLSGVILQHPFAGSVWYD